MSFAGFTFPQRLRTVSAQLRSAAGLDEPSSSYPTSDTFATHGSEWNTLSYPSDGQPTGYQDPYGEIIADNGFNEFGAANVHSTAGSHGLGFDMSMQMNGIEEEGSGYDGEVVKREEALEDFSGAFDGGHQTRLQTRSTRNQPYPTSSFFPSANRSRTSSLASQQSLQLSTLSSPSSGFFPSPLPSPFRENSGTFPSECNGTINPAASVRGSSPSEASPSNAPFARDGSSDSNQAFEPLSSTRSHRRTDSVSSRTSTRGSSLKHTRRNSGSPVKGYSPTKAIRRLLPWQRREICLFQRANPTLKQDEIGRHFKYERSTISKTLKFKDHWLSEAWDQGEPDKLKSHHRGKSRSISSPFGSDDEDESAQQTPNLTSITPQPSPSLGTSTSASSVFAPEPSELPASTTFKGRYPAIEEQLSSWARQQFAVGNVLSDSILQTQARNIARGLEGYDSFKASHTWLEGFKTRAGIRNGTIQGVAASTTMSRHSSRQSVSLDDVAASIQGGRFDEEENDLELTRRRSTRQKRPTFASKSLHRLTGSQSSFPLDGSRAGSPAPSLGSSVKTGGTFGDASMDSESTPTHSTIHSRSTTGFQERASGLAEPLSYSPTTANDSGTPSRLAGLAPSSLMLGDYSTLDCSPQPQYSYGNDLQPYSYETSAFPPPFGSLSTSSSQSSLADFDLGTSTSSLVPQHDLNASPAPSFHHHRSGSTASSTSVYSGLTAFSSANGNGTPLTGSAYGSFRTSPSDRCSDPATPAHGSQFDPSGLQAFAPSPLQQPPAFQQSHESGLHLPQRYLVQQPVDPSLSSSTSSSRRATISGGAPFQGRASTSSVPPSPVVLGVQGQVSLDEAYSSLQTAIQFLGVNDGFARPGDFVLLGDIMSKMKSRREAQGANSTTMSTSSVNSNSPFLPQQSSPFPNVPSRLKLMRTQSASSVPTFGGNNWQPHSHRSNSQQSLLEVDGH